MCNPSPSLRHTHLKCIQEIFNKYGFINANFLEAIIPTKTVKVHSIIRRPCLDNHVCHLKCLLINFFYEIITKTRKLNIMSEFWYNAKPSSLAVLVKTKSNLHIIGLLSDLSTFNGFQDTKRCIHCTLFPTFSKWWTY